MCPGNEATVRRERVNVNLTSQLSAELRKTLPCIQQIPTGPLSGAAQKWSVRYTSPLPPSGSDWCWWGGGGGWQGDWCGVHGEGGPPCQQLGSP